MIVPIRCFSCGKVIAEKFEEYQKLVAEGKSKGNALTEVGIERYCCRRMILSHRELSEDVLQFKV